MIEKGGFMVVCDLRSWAFGFGFQWIFGFEAYVGFGPISLSYA